LGVTKDSSIRFIKQNETDAFVFMITRNLYKLVLLLALGISLGFVSNGCSSNEKDEVKTTMPTKDIITVQEAHTKELMAIPGVVGVYVGELDDKMPFIGVMVKKKTPELEKKIPKSLEGYPVKIDETGEIKPMK
jgi:hypothetical protein